MSFIRHQYFIAILFAFLIVAWFASGMVSAPGDVMAVEKANAAPPFAVRAEVFTARERAATLQIRGRTEANLRVDVKAETAGKIIELPVHKGEYVPKDRVLCKIDPGARVFVANQAEAGLSRARADYDAATSLAKRGHGAKLNVTTQKAALDSARANLATARLDLERTEIKAPFSGILEEQPAKVGDLLGVGSTCATLVATDPLIAVGHVSEIKVSGLLAGMMGTAETLTGEVVEGKLRFVSSSADTKTRTFRIELELANKDRRLRDGLTVNIKIPLQARKAHFLPQALLTMNDAGQIGVKVVREGKSWFSPVDILANTRDGIWVGGLDETVEVITTGQEYVTDGQTVVTHK
jgi:multidrug efflux system membrane fusion protein